MEIQKPQLRWASTLMSKGILDVECRLLSKPIVVTRDLKSRKEQVFWELTYELLRFACEVPYLITSTKYPANITKHFLKIKSNYVKENNESAQIKYKCFTCITNLEERLNICNTTMCTLILTICIFADTSQIW